MTDQCKACDKMWWEYDQKTGRLVDFECPEWETFEQEDHDLASWEQCPRFVPKRSKTELKSCPFCGGRDIRQIVDPAPNHTIHGKPAWRAVVLCNRFVSECGAKVEVIAEDPREAERTDVENWNRRVGE